MIVKCFALEASVFLFFEILMEELVYLLQEEQMMVRVVIHPDVRLVP